MSEFLIKFDPDNEMLDIVRNDESIFFGNVWDFTVPQDIVLILKKCGYPVSYIEGEIEV